MNDAVSGTVLQLMSAIASDSTNGVSRNVLAQWHRFLVSLGAHVREERACGFPGWWTIAGSPQAWLCDLSDFGLITVTGADAEAFLHGQLSCDVRALPPGSATLGCYCTPKGRVLATMLVWRIRDGFQLQLPCGLVEAIRRRLAMYVLRSKVQLRDSSQELVRFGIAGPGAAAVLQAIGIESRAVAYSISPVGNAADDRICFVVAHPGDRFEIVSDSLNAAQSLWQMLVSVAAPCDVGIWDLHAVRAGIADVLPSTQDRLVPQMLNLDLVGGVSFSKGCYPGQEIVARSHYLGRLKRRMYRARLAAHESPAPADEVFCPLVSGQVAGIIVACAQVADGMYEVLATVQSECAARDDVTWRSPTGPRLEWLPLPYCVPTP